MYDIVFLSILRDSIDYLDRYLLLLKDAMSNFENPYVVWCENNSIDGTKERLKLEIQRGLPATYLELDWLGGPKYGSADIPDRWSRLETAWNAATAVLTLDDQPKARYVVFVESDLLWDWYTLRQQIRHLDAGRADVIAPLLFSASLLADGQPWFHDINGFRWQGVNFTNEPPYWPSVHPGPDKDGLLAVDNVGGLVVTTYPWAVQAVWKNKCTLHWPEGTRVRADVMSWIYHP